MLDSKVKEEAQGKKDKLRLALLIERKLFCIFVNTCNQLNTSNQTLLTNISNRLQVWRSILFLLRPTDESRLPHAYGQLEQAASI
jgi:hypothetical protein